MGKLVTVQDLDGNLWQDFDSLIRAITGTIQPESWADVGGPGTIAPLEYRGAVVLIVRQTHDVHAQFVKLVEDLTAIADAHDDDEYPTREKRPPQAPGPAMPIGLGRWSEWRHGWHEKAAAICDRRFLWSPGPGDHIRHVRRGIS